jgi:thioesterase domain-containing protein
MSQPLAIREGTARRAAPYDKKALTTDKMASIPHTETLYDKLARQQRTADEMETLYDKLARQQRTADATAAVPPSTETLRDRLARITKEARQEVAKSTFDSATAWIEVHKHEIEDAIDKALEKAAAARDSSMTFDLPDAWSVRFRFEANSEYEYDASQGWFKAFGAYARARWPNVYMRTYKKMDGPNAPYQAAFSWS